MEKTKKKKVSTPKTMPPYKMKDSDDEAKVMEKQMGYKKRGKK